MSEQLKPCPWCGSEGIRLHTMDAYYCRSCGAIGPMGYMVPSEAGIKAWNTRPIESALRAENAKLRERVAELENEVQADWDRQDELDRRRRFMDRRGYRRCDIAACNCPSWHGGNAEDRLRELHDAVEGRDNGRTLLAVVKELFERDDARNEPQ